MNATHTEWVYAMFMNVHCHVTNHFSVATCLCKWALTVLPKTEDYIHNAVWSLYADVQAALPLAMRHNLGLIGKTWGCTTLSNSAWIDPSNSNWAYMYHGCLQAGLVPHVWHHSFLSGCRGHLGPPHPSPGNEAVWVLLLCTTSSLKHKCGCLAFPFTLFLIWNSRNHSGVIKFSKFHF